MARQQDTAVTGTVGDVIFYKWKDKFCIRSKGRTGTQAPIAVENGGHFGKASGLSARFRKLLAPVLAEPKSRKLMYRLNNALYRLLREQGTYPVTPVQDLAHLRGFSFAEEEPIHLNLVGYLSINRSPDGILMLHLPPFNPAYMSMGNRYPYLKLMIQVAACDVHAEHINRSYEYQLEIPYMDALFPERDIMLPFHCEPGQMTIVAAAMGYLTAEKKPVTEEPVRFGGIVDALWN